MSSKNVLITAKAYQMLLELGFQPHQLLAKQTKLDDRIKSPKSQKFIHIGTKAYMTLLNEFTEDTLLLRRDGYIKSPTSDKLIKVFSKTFNQLAETSSVENLLKLPREIKGDKRIGVQFNVHRETLEERVALLKSSAAANASLLKKGEVSKRAFVDSNADAKHICVDPNTVEKQSTSLPIDKVKTIHLESIVTPKSIDHLIKTYPHDMMMYTTAIHPQTEYVDEEEEVVYDVKQVNGYHATGCLFNNQKAVGFCSVHEDVEHEDQQLEYIDVHRMTDKIKTTKQYEKYLNTFYNDPLDHFHVEGVDLRALHYMLSQQGFESHVIQKTLLDQIHHHDKNNTLSSLCQSHLWFLSNARLFKLANRDNRPSLFVSILPEDIKDQNEFKTKLIKEIQQLRQLLETHINALF